MRNLNEDQKSDLIKEINDRLQDLSVSVLREILSSLKTQEEKKFNGNIIAASSVTGSALHAGDYFDNIRELEAKLPRIDPNNRKKVEKLLSDYYWRDGKVKFISSGKKCDIYHCFEKQSGYPLVVYLYKE